MLAKLGFKILDFILEKVLDKIIKVNFTEKRVIKKLKKHPVFDRLNQYRNKSIYDFKIQNKYKRLIIKKFLEIKFDTIRDYLGRDMCTNCYKKCDNGTTMVEHMLRAIQEYERKSIEIGIPEDFILKFKSFHQPKVDIGIELIETVCNGDFHANCVEKQFSMFDFIQGIMAITLSDMQKTANSFNGNLDNLVNKLGAEGKLKHLE